MPGPSLDVAVSVRGATKRYGRFTALDSLSLDIRRGEVFALLGPNGAGKTTLISLVAGIARPSGGTIRVLGHDVQRDYQLARRAVGLVPQEVNFDPFFTVEEALRFQAGYFGVRLEDGRLMEILSALGLADKRHANTRSLSGGMKRRLLIAKALVHRPAVLFLDEPTAGVDVELRRDLWTYVQKLRAGGTTIVLTTHYLEEAEELADRIGVIKNGRLLLVDDKSALLARYGRRSVRLLLDRAAQSLPQAVVGAGATLAEGGRAVVLNPGQGESIAVALSALSASGLRVVDVQTREPRLETVIIELLRTQGPLPEADRPGELEASAGASALSAAAVALAAAAESAQPSAAGPDQGEATATSSAASVQRPIARRPAGRTVNGGADNGGNGAAIGIATGPIDGSANGTAAAALQVHPAEATPREPIEPGLGIRTLYRKEVTRFLRVPGQTVLSPLITTALYFVVFGYSLGGRLREVDGVPYARFLVPGLVMLGLINNAFLNTSSSLFIMKLQGTMVDLLVTPLSYLEVLVAFLAAGCTRALLVAVLTWLTAAAFVGFQLPHPILALVAALLVACAFAAGGLIVALWADKFEQVNFIPTFVITPLSFLGGVFYSASMLPEGLRHLLRFNPIYYMIELMRFALLGVSDVSPWVGFSLIAALTAAVTLAALELLRRGYKLRS
jgi:ABC-2 type transport system ATP-binding protein